jgi:hypothetical protein
MVDPESWACSNSQRYWHVSRSYEELEEEWLLDEAIDKMDMVAAPHVVDNNSIAEQQNKK